MGIPSYFKYWGKAKKDPLQSGADYHLLVYHCLDVAAVGKVLLAEDKSLTKELAHFLDVTPKQLQSLLVFLLALHDLGKFASAFQKLYTAPDGTLLNVGSCDEYNGNDFRHDRLGFYFWEKITPKIVSKLAKQKVVDRWEIDDAAVCLMVLMDCMLGHHGQPIKKDAPSSIKAYTEEQNDLAADVFCDDIFSLLKCDFPFDKLICGEWRRKLELVSWQIAGIAVLADWIGSDRYFFNYKSSPEPLNDYWQLAQQIAIKAVNSTDLDKAPLVKPFISIQEHFGYTPTPLQHWAETVNLDDSPQLFILEDVTGAGKTEAALALTHRLMAVGGADGFYFGLPTMATSNAMFSRVAKHYLKMLDSTSDKQPSIVLAHGAREMNDVFSDAVREAKFTSKCEDKNYHHTDSTATAQCNQWLADSRKKALLAPVGVGTIDQALLAVLPRRHQSLRLLGLNRKVLIFDEVHAADEYMFELLESLLALHLHQGGSAILLTATLSLKQRQRLTNIWLTTSGHKPKALTEDSFPLATNVNLNCEKLIFEKPLASRSDVSREVLVEHLTCVDECINTILNAVAQNKCVVWVRNSVDDALHAFQQLQAHLVEPQQCILFHSRFVLADRKTIESQVLETFGKTSTGEMRSGKVLIATQVFQESLDADADVMISDICPIDDLIQRTGRLHRHTRDAKGNYQSGIIDSREQPKLYIHAPEYTDTPKADWLSKSFINTQYVYRSAGRLWLGLRKLLELGAIRMPEQARDLIEAVYSDEALLQIPESLTNQENELFAAGRAKAHKAKSNLLKWQQFGYCVQSANAWHEDITDISTRFSDIETVEVLLLKQDEKGNLTPWVDDEKFAVQLSTVKLSKNKYADKLMPIPDSLQTALEQLQQKYIQYMQVWLPEVDPDFTYHPITGFSEKISPL